MLFRLNAGVVWFPKFNKWHKQNYVDWYTKIPIVLVNFKRGRAQIGYCVISHFLVTKKRIKKTSFISRNWFLTKCDSIEVRYSSSEDSNLIILQHPIDLRSRWLLYRGLTEIRLRANLLFSSHLQCNGDLMELFASVKIGLFHLQYSSLMRDIYDFLVPSIYHQSK